MAWFSIHPIYEIYRVGEFVQRGAVAGLSVDKKKVIVAPVSGWVRAVEERGGEGETEICLQIELTAAPPPINERPDRHLPA